MIKANIKKHRLVFKRPAGTSRGIMTFKDSWFIILEDDEQPGITGIGECGPLPGLSLDHFDLIDNFLNKITDPFAENILQDVQLTMFPSVKFGLESALFDLHNGGRRKLFHNEFSKGEKAIDINGLVWMGDIEFMKEQIDEKIDAGYSCIKMKIGAIDFEDEFRLLKQLRDTYPQDILELRVDANGAFEEEIVHSVLDRLSSLQIHSIEQPVKPGLWELLANLCKESPVPVALDEELIPVTTDDGKENLLDLINPQYLILKPSLLGGFANSEDWINRANKRNIGWWITSALESNIGLNAIAQWTYSIASDTIHGLGTGQLFTNNFDSPLQIANGKLHYRPKYKWNLDELK